MSSDKEILEEEIKKVETNEDTDEEEDEYSEDEDDEEEIIEKRVYLPGQKLANAEELVFDKTAYILYHQASTAAPCLSFDVIKDNHGNSRETFPLSCYVAAGTQSQNSHSNSVVVMKMSNLHPLKMKKRSEDSDDEDDSDSDSDEESDETNKDKKPVLEAAMFKHPGAVNRLRTTRIGEASLAATWSDTGKVYVWNLTRPLQAVDSRQGSKFNSDGNPSLFSYGGHKCEGFALDWSPITQGRLATGDCRKGIHLWHMSEDGKWSVDQKPFAGHSSSVEDIQWSPTEANVMASCSVDKSIKIWDVRSAQSKGCKISIDGAHDSDVNVISWNRLESRFIASGGDDGIIKVWDLCMYKRDRPSLVLTPVAKFKHHASPITSVEWNPDDSSVLAAAGEDDQLTIWDIAVEKDEAPTQKKRKVEDSGDAEDKDDDDDEEPDVPQQLLFIHQGQKEIKELHWHPQLPGVVISTALDGFNVFRTISV